MSHIQREPYGPSFCPTSQAQISDPDGRTEAAF
jgi:hypothetical protein